MPRWPNHRYWTVGILALPPEEIARPGVQFILDADDLGPLLATTISDSQIGEFEVVRHHESPDHGTEVRVDIGVSRDDALNAVARTLGFDSRSFSWISPYRSYRESVVGAGWSFDGEILVPPPGEIGRASLESARIQAVRALTADEVREALGSLRLGRAQADLGIGIQINHAIESYTDLEGSSTLEAARERIATAVGTSPRRRRRETSKAQPVDFGHASIAGLEYFVPSNDAASGRTRVVVVGLNPHKKTRKVPGKKSYTRVETGYIRPRRLKRRHVPSGEAATYWGQDK